jgi:DNA-binding NarL/FixJ family response regulator
VSVSIPIKAAVIDDHEAIRLGIAGALRPEPRITIVPGASTVRDFLATRSRAQVVLLDLQLGDESDPKANTEALIEAGYKVLIYSIADNPRALRRALAGGAHGVCRKAEPLAQMAAGILLVAEGQMVISQEVLAAIEGDTPYVEANLGAREKEVLSLYAGGLEIPQIARRLYITENSVKEYLKRIRVKYTQANRPANNKLDLLKRAIEDGIVPPVRPLV